MRRLTSLATAAATVAAMAVAPATAIADDDGPAEDLREEVTVESMDRHLKALQRIAEANGNSRASGTAGYDASAEYVAQKAREAGYDVTVQPFSFPFFGENAPAQLQRVAPQSTDYVVEEDFSTMRYSGSGDATADVTGVDLALAPTDRGASTSGCQPEDFAGFPEGDIALVQRGACTFATKALNAQAAGAVGVIVFNQGNGESRMGVVNGTLGEPGVTIPVVGATFALGEELAQPGTVARLATDTSSEIRHTVNVLAETPVARDDDDSSDDDDAFNADEVIVVGAHLDSVPAGPGINDNGTGSAGILSIAEGLAEVTDGFEADDEGEGLARRVRFAWWGAEESGLLGAEHYVASLTHEELDEIVLNLNFDMIGSPNYGRFVYDGDGSADLGGMEAPTGSDVIEDVFVNAFDRLGLASAPTAFSGRSDYGPFIEVGIPAGGLFTGAEGIKTEDEVALFGGTAGIAYDPCYHLACDDISNVSYQGLEEMSAAAAITTWHFATVANPFAGVPESNNDVSGELGGGGLHEHHHDHEAA